MTEQLKPSGWDVSMPDLKSRIVTVELDPETAECLRLEWEANHVGPPRAEVRIAGDDGKFLWTGGKHVRRVEDQRKE